MSSKLRIVLLREIPEDESLRRQWNELVELLEKPQVFYTFEWALAVQRAYHATLRTMLFLAYDEQESLCGVAALATDISGEQVSFLCATTGDYCDFLSSNENRALLVGGVFGELKKLGINRMAFANLPADSVTVAAMRESVGDSHYFCFARTGYVCAQVSLGALERRPGEDKPVLPRKKMLRRFLNAMGRESPVRLDHAQSWDAIEPILHQFMQSHVARFLVTGRISNMARAERRTFLAELAKLLAEPGWIAVTRMMSGKNAFAWNYGFQFHDTWFWYQPTFDSGLEKYSPGFCLLAKLIEEASEQSEFTTVDLGLGAEEYKERFANRSRETLYVTVKSSRLQHLREIVRYRATALVTKAPRMEAVVRVTVERLQRFAEYFKRQGPTRTLSWLARKSHELIWSRTEVFFYDWCGPSFSEPKQLTLHQLDLILLATAVTQYVEDPETLSYLLRSAQRLRSGSAEGFVLLDAEGMPVHFAWANVFEGFFLAELNARVKAPSPDAVMLFDCWTPVAVRGRGHYGIAIELMARQVAAKGKLPWIFSAGENLSSVRGLEKGKFIRRYSLVRQQLLGLQTVKGETPIPSTSPVVEVSARAS